MNETNSNENMSGGKSGGMSWMIVAVLVLVLVGAYFYMNKGSKTMTADDTTADPIVNEPTQADNEEGVVAETPEEDVDGVQSITVEGGVFYFKPNKITVKKGQPVKVTFNNVEGMHDFVIDELDVKTEVIRAGESQTVEFTPMEAGEYEFYCSVTDHRAKGMKGVLVVE